MKVRMKQCKLQRENNLRKSIETQEAVEHLEIAQNAL